MAERFVVSNELNFLNKKKNKFGGGGVESRWKNHQEGGVGDL